MAADTITKAREALQDRLGELQDEAKQIEKALASLGGRARPRARSTGTRTRRSGGRADQAVKLIQNNPGITVSELGKKMKLKHPNYLYRVLPDLEKEGKIAKDGNGYTVKS